MLTIQYLEDSPDLVRLDKKSVVDRLHAATDRLPISHLLVGWNVPMPLLEACRRETERLGIRLIRWQPLLTIVPALHPSSGWRTVGLTGSWVPGYRGLPEFTFSCPNHPAVLEALTIHLDDDLQQGIYQGFFLDRVRFPSPFRDPVNHLACFCSYCFQKAARDGVDLDQIRSSLQRLVKKRTGLLSLVGALISGKAGRSDNIEQDSISQLLAFREKSICDFLTSTSQRLRAAHMEVGLDCFSPSLTHMVGQDLARLSQLVDWVKLMTYAHTDAPAGLPFELGGLAANLIAAESQGEKQALEWVQQASGLALPSTLDGLQKEGLSSLALEMEIAHGIQASSAPVLAGIELVDLAGVTRLHPEQVRSDLRAMSRSSPAGLAISWDLLHIPVAYLDLVRSVYFSK